MWWQEEMDNENTASSNTKLMTPGHNVIVDNGIEGDLERRLCILLCLWLELEVVVV